MFAKGVESEKTVICWLLWGLDKYYLRRFIEDDESIIFKTAEHHRLMNNFFFLHIVFQSLAAQAPALRWSSCELEVMAML